MKRIEVFGWVGVGTDGELERQPTTAPVHPQLKKRFPRVFVKRKSVPGALRALKVRVTVEEA